MRIIKDWLVALIAISSSLILIILGSYSLFFIQDDSWVNKSIAITLILMGLGLQLLTKLIIKSIWHTGKPLEQVS